MSLKKIGHLRGTQGQNIWVLPTVVVHVGFALQQTQLTMFTAGERVKYHI